MTKQNLRRLAQTHAVARLSPSDPLPDWADGEGFVSISRSSSELSVVCPQERIPSGVQQDRDWTCYHLVGPFAFDETGVVLKLIRPLSAAGIGVFVVSTFDGDHLMVKSADREKTEALLEAQNYTIS